MLKTRAAPMPLSLFKNVCVFGIVVPYSFLNNIFHLIKFNKTFDKINI